MQNKILYQLRIDLDDTSADEFLKNNSIKSCKSLNEILDKERACLMCQYEAFSSFVNECEKDNLTNSALYKWTKDVINDEEKKKKYMKSFTIYVDNEQLYDKNIAERIEKKILELNCNCILKVNKYDSDPKNNPQPPKKYFN